ncbi:MAG: phage integrase N-terminal SAM-like domain-containing protein [Methanosarcina sp.]
MIYEYINFLELQDKKEKTIENKTWGLVPFLLYIGEKDVRSVTKADVEDFMLSLKKSGKKPSSIHMYTFNTRFFLNWVLPGNRFFENVKVKRPETDYSRD